MHLIHSTVPASESSRSLSFSENPVPSEGLLPNWLSIITATPNTEERELSNCFSVCADIYSVMSVKLFPP